MQPAGMRKRIERATFDLSGCPTDCPFDVSLHRSQEGFHHAVRFGACYPPFGIFRFRTNEGTPRDLVHSPSYQFDSKHAPLDGSSQIISIDRINP
jgi:hypothetical protein